MLRSGFCPFSELAADQLKTLIESYRLATAAAAEYHELTLADRQQVQAALRLADRLGELINCYLTAWEEGAPCLNYACGWEYCERSLKLLHALDDLPSPHKFDK